MAIVAALAMFVSTSASRGFCPQPTPKACSAFFESKAVFLGTVLSKKGTLDTDGSTERWTYKLHVDRMFRGSEKKTVTVFVLNDSARRMLDVGRQYLIFATLEDGRLRTGDDCGPLSDDSRLTENVREIEALSHATTSAVEGEVRFELTDTAVTGVGITISGEGHTYTTASGKDGAFRAVVPPGHYKVEVDPAEAKLFDLSFLDLQNVVLAPGQCAQALFLAPGHETQGDLNDAACEPAEAEQDEMNALYESLVARAAGEPDVADRIRASQRAWLAFVEAQQDALWGGPDPQAEHGSVLPMCRCLARQEMVKARSEQLRRMMTHEEGDVCSWNLAQQPVVGE